jgi:hypothetical protein
MMLPVMRAGTSLSGKCTVRCSSRVAVFALLLATGPTFAANQSDYDDCMQRADVDRTITGCTRIIDDDGEQPVIAGWL